MKNINAENEKFIVDEDEYVYPCYYVDVKDDKWVIGVKHNGQKEEHFVLFNEIGSADDVGLRQKKIAIKLLQLFKSGGINEVRRLTSGEIKL